ncbi:MAG: hypothetical protein D6696_21435 [Acidobacteria bacterium]|nr:MAG: hypothetical protein D6696_21435 [Acidobacteriota bacterium]
MKNPSKIQEESLGTNLVMALGIPVLMSIAGFFIGALLGGGHVWIGGLIIVAVTAYAGLMVTLYASTIGRTETSRQLFSTLSPIVGFGLGYPLMLFIAFQVGSG